MLNDHIFEAFPPVETSEWEQRIRQDLQGADYKEKLRWETGEGISALPFYRREDIENQPAPLKGIEQHWEIRQPVSKQEVHQANRIARQAVAGGADGLTFTMHTDSSAGRLSGVSVQNQQAFNHLLEGIDLSVTKLHFDAGTASAAILSMLHNFAGEAARNVTGSVCYDPFASFLRSGTVPQNSQRLTDNMASMVSFCAEELPKVRCLAIDGRLYHESGGTVVQQLSYALASASEYFAILSDAGFAPSDIAPVVHFNLSIGGYYFLEIAKFRAARRLWQKLLEAYKMEGNAPMYLHGATSGWNKTRFDPYVNMLRTTTEGMSAAMAGCNAITVHPFDEAFCPPDEFSRRMARNSQIILKEEAYIDKVADPAAGSYYVEMLTDKLAKAAWHGFQEVEKQGGMMQAIRDEMIQTGIDESRRKRDRQIAGRGRVFVGTNHYPNPDDSPIKKGQIPSPVALRQTDHTVEMGGGGLIPSLKKALHDDCTLGDLVQVLHNAETETIAPVHSYRGPQVFEKLRLATQKHNTTPAVLTLPLGDKKMRQARSTFAANFFGCAGYIIDNPVGFDSAPDALSAIKQQQPDIVVLCSSDDEYKTLVPELCRELDKLDRRPIAVLAGYPKEQIKQYKKAGIDEFVHSQSDIIETLRYFQKRLGIIQN